MAERAYWLAWSKIAGIGPVLLRRLQQRFNTLEAAWGANAAELGTVEGIGPQTLESIVAQRSGMQPTELLASHEQANPQFWTPADPDYPRLLLETVNPPALLYYRGQVNPAENQGTIPAIAIVGTRNPSEYGRKWTRRLSALLAQQGFTIISGMADGIDAEAHRSCLEVGGRTIAVFGTGVDVVYPWRNRSLYTEIVERGLVLSEYPAGTKPDRAHFPQRNRIVAALSRAVIVTEAPQKSGALITAYLANEYGRDVYVLPGSLDMPNSMGCLELMNRGAQLILGEQHLLDLLGELPQLDRPVPQTPADAIATLHLEPPLPQILAALRQDAVPLDYLVEQTGLPTSVLSSSLLELELLGLVSQLPGMRYQRS